MFTFFFPCERFCDGLTLLFGGSIIFVCISGQGKRLYINNAQIERITVMKKYDVILFDLDGTLTDPGIGITNSIMYALEKYGIEVKDRSELYKFIGPPLEGSFMRYYNMTEKEAERAVSLFREYFSDRGIFENSLLPGIRELLSALRSGGKTIALATSKPGEFAKRILSHFDIDKYFDFVSASELDGTRVDKGEVIAYAIERLKITDKRNVVMVGDRSYDIKGANANGIDSVGVLFGYGSREELTEAGAVYIAQNADELRDILLP